MFCIGKFVVASAVRNILAGAYQVIPTTIIVPGALAATSVHSQKSNMEVCATPLWDTSLTWLTNNPDFTPCFHQTILVMVPAVFILLLSPLQFYLQCSSQTRSIPWCVSVRD